MTNDTIYNNTSGFGLVSPELQAEMRAHYEAGGKVEIYVGSWWRKCHRPDWCKVSIYRAVKPAPTPDVIAWERLPKWAQWVARDKNGYIFCHGIRPVMHQTYWLGVGGDRRIGDFPDIVTIGTCDWRDSLQQRPEGV